MKNPLKNKGFREILIKGIIFVLCVVAIQKAISWLLSGTYFFNTYLDIPQGFQIGKGIISISIVNALLFGLVVLLILSYKKLFNIKKFTFKKSQLWFILLTIVFLLLHYFLKYLINQNIEFFSQAMLFWAIIKVLIQIFMAMTIFVAIYGTEFSRYVLKEFKKEIVITTIVTICFFILMIFIQNLWTYFSGFISNILYHIFSLFFSNVTYQPFVTSFTMSEGGGPLLGINGFKAIIGKPCSGIDSFLLFTSLYTLIFILDYKRLKKGLAITLFFIGVTGMFLTNLLRIFLLFIVGAFINAKFAVGMFHSNIGWILFIFYFFIFWWITSKYIYKRSFK